MKKICDIHGLTEFAFREKENRHRCKRCVVAATQARRLRIKVMAVEYKGGKCMNCGYDKCVDALEFHHRDPKTKDFGIGKDGYTRAWEAVKKELDKCDMFCSNCHKEQHYKIRMGG